MEIACFLVDGEPFHRGDSFTVPEDTVSTLRLEPQELEVVAEVGTGLTCRSHGPSNG